MRKVARKSFIFLCNAIGAHIRTWALLVILAIVLGGVALWAEQTPQKTLITEAECLITEAEKTLSENDNDAEKLEHLLTRIDTRASHIFGKVSTCHENDQSTECEKLSNLLNQLMAVRAPLNKRLKALRSPHRGPPGPR